MSRGDLGLTLLVALIATIAVVFILTRRYTKYRHRLARGRRDLKPVRRPFWMT